MHSAMVAAVMMTSSQRQPPLSLRTRVTSASTGPAWTWGSSNSTLAAAAGPDLSDGTCTRAPDQLAVAEDRGLATAAVSEGSADVWRSATRGAYSKMASMPAAVRAFLRAAIQPW